MEISCAIFLLLLFGHIHITVGMDALTQMALPHVQQLMLCYQASPALWPFLLQETHTSFLMGQMQNKAEKLLGTSLEGDRFF